MQLAAVSHRQNIVQASDKDKIIMPSFDEYIKKEFPYIPPTTLFDRGDIEYADNVKAMHCTDGKFRSFLFKSLIRYLNGDWGEMCDIDKVFNNSVVSKGGNKNGEVVTGLYEYWLGDDMGPATLYVRTEFCEDRFRNNKTTVELMEF